MKKIRIQIIGVVLFGSLAFVSCNSSGSGSAKDNHEHEHQQNDAKEYTCSMHPEVVVDKPGDCPKCGMKLVEKEKENHTEHEHNHE